MTNKYSKYKGFCKIVIEKSNLQFESFTILKTKSNPDARFVYIRLASDAQIVIK